MKPIHFPSLVWLPIRGTILPIAIFLLSIVSFLAAQGEAGTQEAESQRIYRRAYEEAMADSPGSTWPCSRLWWGEPSCRLSASRLGGSRG